MSPDGVITTVAGTGASNFSGDGGPATSATLDFPTGIAVDGQGNLYIADFMNQDAEAFYAKALLLNSGSPRVIEAYFGTSQVRKAVEGAPA